jgi:catechol 2,3-dioxygenase-like lactoylglutathione lyase family enzyme
MVSVPAAAPARPAIAVPTVDHTGITVSSLDDALSFWVGALGFEHLYTWEFQNTSFLEELVGVEGAAMRLAMIRGPGHLIELLEYHSPDDRRVLKPRSCDVGSVHVGFHVKNIDALLQQIAALGWRPLGRVQTIVSGERIGLRLAYVRGPDGVTLEFLQRPEALARGEDAKAGPSSITPEKP